MISIFLFVLVLWAFDVEAENLAVMKPVDPYLEEGKTLILNCTLTKLDGLNSSSFYIRSHGVNYTYPWVVPIDESTAQLRKERITMNEGGYFVCRIPGFDLGEYASQSVHVYRNPEKPRLTNCTLRRMTILECTWLPTIQVQNNRTNFNRLKHILQISKERGENIYHDCSNNQGSSCSVSLVKDDDDILPLLKERICVTLNVTFPPYVEENSDFKCWNITEIIYPEAPKDLRTEETNGGCLLEWDQPFRERYKSVQITFYLTLVPIYNKSQRIFAETERTSFILTSCQPHTKYLVCISSMSNLGGFHSEIADFAFETSPTVPCRHVDISQYSTFIDRYQGKMLIYWKPLPRKEFCGPGFGYALLMKIVPSVEIDSSTILSGQNGINWASVETMHAMTSSVQYKISDSCNGNDCIFAIVPKNDIGYRLDNMSSFHLYDKLVNNSIAIENLVVEIFETTVFLSWNTLDINNLSSRMNKSVTVAVYTCLSNALSESVCKNDLNWEIVTTNLGRHKFSVKDHSLSDLSYGIAVFVDGISPEILWSQRVFNLYGKVLKPSQVAVKSAKIASSMLVYWSFNQDECLECSYVVYFGIFYCQSFDHKICSGNFTNVNVSNHLRMSEIHHLEAGAPYLFWMASFSRMSMSPYTNKIITNQQKPETKYIVLICVVIVILISMLLICIFKNSKKTICETFNIHVPEEISQLEQYKDSKGSIGAEEVVNETDIPAESYATISLLNNHEDSNRRDRDDFNSDYCSGSSLASHQNIDNLDRISAYNVVSAQQFPLNDFKEYYPIHVACGSNASDEELAVIDEC